MVWNSIEKFAIQGISFVIGIILARILMPTDYGLIGMLAIFFAFSELFMGSGFSTALIQKKDRTEVDYSTIFHFNFIVGLIFLIRWLAGLTRSRAPYDKTHDSALEILKQRYAKGEINKDEFEEKKRDLM